MYGKDTLYAYTIRNTADSHSLCKTGTLTCDYISLKYLDTLAVTLLDLQVSLYIVTNFNLGVVVSEILILNNFY